MRKLILTFVLGTLCLCAFSQEAFYIYRNDGDFNGFFYDEVIEMRQSKFGVDSIEYDRWVTQEVVLADTIYRIPLAAIDSIGFQQPEIKFNPRVKFMEQEGLCPYVITANEFGVTFQDLPANLVPREGDVLIGLPSDDIAKEKYEEGSFSCVVEQVINNGGGSVSVSGHAVEDLSDVFEQYVTVEQIGVTKEGQVVRRIAGCTPDGLPRAKVKQVSGDEELTLIDFEGTITRTWNPTANSAIELSTQVGLVVKFRAAFNISWTRFRGSLSHDMVIKAKPALAMSLFQGFEYDTGELLPCELILFPAACPIFGINPIPSLFLRGEGKLEAKLNMPQVRLGIGQHFAIDNGSWFPVTLGLHLVPDENKEVSNDMLDLSGQVSFLGYVQTGIKFSGDIFTANWVRKIFRFSLGTYLYAGPKVSGALTISADIPTEEGEFFEGASLYETLKQSVMAISLISLDLESKGYFSVFTKEGEKKFFDKNWSFLNDTVFLAPQITTPIDVMMGDNQVRLRLNVGQGFTLGYCWAEIGIFEGRYTEPIDRIGHFDLTRVSREQAKEGFYDVYPFSDLKAKGYFAVPIVHVGSLGEFVLWDYATIFNVPCTLEVQTPSVHFGAKTELTQTISIKTNAPKDDIEFVNGTNWALLNSITTVDEKEGRYDLVVKAEPNMDIFDREEHMSKVIVGDFENQKEIPIDVYQEAPDLSHAGASADGYWHYHNEDGWADGYFTRYGGEVTGVRSDNNNVTLDGTYTEEYDIDNSKKYTVTYTIHLQIQRTDEDVEIGGNTCHRKRTCSGYVTNHFVYSDKDNGSWKTYRTTDREISFTDAVGGEECTITGTLSSLTENTDYSNSSHPDVHVEMPEGEISSISVDVGVL